MSKSAEKINYEQFDIDYNSIKLIWNTFFQVNYIKLNNIPVVTNKNSKDVHIILFILSLDTFLNCRLKEVSFFKIDSGVQNLGPYAYTLSKILEQDFSSFDIHRIKKYKLHLGTRLTKEHIDYF